ncbi:MAG: 50S ribosomal L9 C-terminal domain-containing protein, partial [Patescibacteria group bacterium]
EMIKKVQQASQYYAEMTERLKNEQMEFLVKTGERGEVFESVNKEMVSERLSVKGYIDYEVVLEKPIRSVGDHVLKVRFPGGIKVEMKIIVKPKK